MLFQDGKEVFPGAVEDGGVHGDEVVRVVDFMGHPGDQDAEGDHLVGLDELPPPLFRLFFRFFPGLDIRLELFVDAGQLLGSLGDQLLQMVAVPVQLLLAFLEVFQQGQPLHALGQGDFQLHHGDRFLDIVDRPHLHGLDGDGKIRLAGNHDAFKVGLDGYGLLHEGKAIHLGHHDVGHQEMKWAFFKKGQGIRTADRAGCRIAEALHLHGEQLENHGLIVDNEYFSFACHGPRDAFSS
jgi:hypothetical protein